MLPQGEIVFSSGWEIYMCIYCDKIHILNAFVLCKPPPPSPTPSPLKGKIWGCSHAHLINYRTYVCGFVFVLFLFCFVLFFAAGSEMLAGPIWETELQTCFSWGCGKDKKLPATMEIALKRLILLFISWPRCSLMSCDKIARWVPLVSYPVGIFAWKGCSCLKHRDEKLV